MTDRELARKLHAAWAAENPYDWNAQWEAVVKTARTLVTAELAVEAVPGEDEIGLKVLDCCLVSPVGGSPTESERLVAESAWEVIRPILATLQAQIAMARDEVELWKAYAAGNSKPLDFADSKRITTPAPENGNGPVQ